jgi:hypothetical protein
MDKPEVDWNQAPKGARWWAVDANGEAHWFLEPNIAPFTDFWFSEPVPAPLFGFCGSWRESLAARPARPGCK